MKRQFVLFLILLNYLSSFGEPVDPSARKRIVLQDGREIEVRFVGDESGWCYYDEQEKTYYSYDTVSNDFLRISADQIERKTEEQKLRQKTRGIGDASTHIGTEGYKGKYRGLVILVEFSDCQFDKAHSKAYYNKMFNKRNLNDSKFTGSVKDYFLEQSNGQFELEFDIAGPIKMPNPVSYYGANFDQDKKDKLDANLGELVVKACRELDNTVDYSKYDWDGDGEIEQVGILFSGISENFFPGEHPEYIWSQRSFIGYYKSQKAIKLDNVTVDVFFCASELRGEGVDNGIGSICHEFSHCLGLPDMYDVNNPSAGTGNWDLMCYGGHNKNGFVPAGYTAFEKMYCGWQQPIELTDDIQVTNMKALSLGGETYIVHNKAYPQEFYMLENRQPFGFDKGLPGQGLLITYVDFNDYSFSHGAVNNNSKLEPERYTIIVADGGSDKNRQGCCFPVGTHNSFTNTSSPQSKLNHKNIDGSYLLSKPIRDIAYDSNSYTISFSFANMVNDQNYTINDDYYVSEAGTLNSLISEERKWTLNSLRLSGYINGTDLKLIREMSGIDSNGNPTNGSLRCLDLKDVIFVNGGDAYYKDNYIIDDYMMPSYAFRQSRLQSVILPSYITSTGREVFSYCIDLEDVELGDRLGSIGAFAFFQNSSLKSIELGYDIKELYSGAFLGCSNLQLVDLNEGLEYINNQVFSGCTNLQQINLPSSIKRIMSKAFDECSSLIEIISNIETPFDIPDDVFPSDCYQNAKLYVPYAKKDMYKSRKGWKNFKNIIEMSATNIDKFLIDSNKPFDVYSLTGKIIRKKVTTVKGLGKGIYLIKGKKIIVN